MDQRGLDWATPREDWSSRMLSASTNRRTSGLASCRPVSLPFFYPDLWLSLTPWLDDFCLRACVDGPNAPAYCQHIYDVCKSLVFCLPDLEIFELR